MIVLFTEISPKNLREKVCRKNGALGGMNLPEKKTERDLFLNEKRRKIS